MKHIEELVQIALGYEEIAQLTVGDVTIVKRPNTLHVEQLMGDGEIPDPNYAPTHDEMVEQFVEDMEGPDPE